MVLVTRDDLKLSKGKLAAQCSHAAVHCAMKAKKKAARLYERWNNVGARKIVLRAEDEAHLRQLYAKALEGGLVCDLVKDAGHTEIPAGTVTVVGLGPGSRDSIDSLTGSFSLV